MTCPDCANAYDEGYSAAVRAKARIVELEALRDPDKCPHLAWVVFDGLCTGCGMPRETKPPSGPRTPLGRMLADLIACVEHGHPEVVADYLADFTPDELDVLGHVADRLERGRETYGPMRLEDDTRDLRAERAMESWDVVVYSAMLDLREGRS